MPSHIAVVTAKKKGGKGGHVRHAHPVRILSVEPTDNGGFSTKTEMHPAGGKGSDPYMPGQVMTGAHPNLAQALKHIKGALTLKNDAQEQGEGELEGGDPGTSPDAE